MKEDGGGVGDGGERSERIGVGDGGGEHGELKWWEERRERVSVSYLFDTHFGNMGLGDIF